MYDLITIGDIKLDTFVVLDNASVQCQLKMPDCLLCLEYGAKIPVNVVDSQIAGSAPNVAVGLARLKKKTAVISNMGVDGTREMAIKHLKKEGVDDAFIHIAKDEASSYSVVLNFHGERTILASHIHHAYHLPKPIPKTPWMFVCEMGPGYEALFKSLISLVKKDSVRIAFNPGTIQWHEKKPILFELIKYTDILFVNREEAQAITGSSSIEIHHLAPALHKLGAKIVLITDGKNGSYFFNGASLSFCPIFPAKLVEMTGAGDAFASGFMGALLHEQSPHEAMRWGTLNSASVVEHVGPTAGLLTEAKIRARLSKHPNFKVEPM